jgi:PAT family beta-lactamase induction signal transducer AmpG
MAVIFLLGISSGFPSALLGSALGYWMKEVNVDIKTISFFSLVGIAYTLKFLWAPLIDKLNIPVLGKLMGRRKSWMLLTQLLMIFSIIKIGQIDLANQLELAALYCVILGFASASQDIVIDAYRVEILEKEEYGLGAASITFGWRVGSLVAGYFAFLLSSEAYGYSWSNIYLLLSGLTLFGLFVSIFGPRPKIEKTLESKKTIKEWLSDAVISPFSDFMKRKGWILFLLFVLLFKLGDAMMSGVLMGAFYKDLGTDTAILANITKVYGFVSSVVGAFFGGYLITKIGLIRTLWIGAILQAATNLLFALLAQTGNDITLLTTAIITDNFCGALATTAFVAFISGLCNLNYTATQYALLSALSSVGRTVISSFGGGIVEKTSWAEFFVITAVAAIPGIIALYFITKFFKSEVDNHAKTA